MLASMLWVAASASIRIRIVVVLAARLIADDSADTPVIYTLWSSILTQGFGRTDLQMQRPQMLTPSTSIPPCLSR